MRKNLKVIAIIISLFMLATMLCGCNKAEKTSDNFKTGDTFTYWCMLPSATSQTITSFNEMLLYQEMEKATGTKVNFIHPQAGTTGSEAFQILLASADFPDMMEYSWSTYTGGPDQAIEDGVIISLNDYMEDYAPNYYELMEGEKAKENSYSYKVDAISINGNYYGFKGLNIGSCSGFGGLYVRKDMLDRWGLDVPVTIDDWDIVLKTAKENGIKYPITGTKGIFTANSSPSFNTAWNVAKNFYSDNGKVKFGPFEEKYVDYLEKMNEWYKAGYIDIDYITNTSTEVEGAMTNGSSIASFGYVGGGLGKLLPAMEERDPNYNLAACPYPVMNKGDVPWFQEVADNATDPSIAISANCGKNNKDRYKEAIRWCDYLYSDEGAILSSFGVEGETYTLEKDENGEEHYIYTDVIMDHEKIGAHSVNAALWHFFRPANGPGFTQHPDYLKGFYPYEQQRDAIEVWNKYSDVAKEHVLPGTLSYTSEDAATFATVESQEEANLETAISNRIAGKITTEQFKTEMSRIKKAGYDKLIKITQNSYDRYMKIKNDK